MESTLRRDPIIILALMILVVAAGPTLAHPPYFSQVQAIILPDGQPGEMRLLRGDGIFFADPARIIVLDRENRLLARSHRTVPMSLICDSNLGSCWGYDHAAGQVLNLDPTTFWLDGQIVPRTANERYGLWEIEDGEESWGFALRDTSMFEYVVAELSLASQRPVGLAILALLGFLMAPIAFVPARRPKKTNIWRLGFWAAGILLRVSIFAVLMLFSVYVYAFAGFSLTSWSAGLLVGAGLFILSRALLKRMAVSMSRA